MPKSHAMPFGTVSQVAKALEDRPLDYAIHPIRKFRRGQWSPQRLELLVRPEKAWNLPTIDFVQAMADLELQTLLDRRIVADAIRYLMIHPEKVLAVNVSADSLADTDFVTNIIEGLVNSGVDGSRLYLEITQHRPMKSFTATAIESSRLHQKGVRIGLDDVGLGHHATTSSMEMSFIDYIKLDRHMISRSAIDAMRRQRLMQTLKAAHELGLEVVVEGVETKAQLDVAYAMKVRMAQGFLWDAPVTLRQLPAHQVLQLGSHDLDQMGAPD